MIALALVIPFVIENPGLQTDYDYDYDYDYEAEEDDMNIAPSTKPGTLAALAEPSLRQPWGEEGLVTLRLLSEMLALTSL